MCTSDYIQLDTHTFFFSGSAKVAVLLQLLARQFGALCPRVSAHFDDPLPLAGFCSPCLAMRAIVTVPILLQWPEDHLLNGVKFSYLYHLLL